MSNKISREIGYEASSIEKSYRLFKSKNITRIIAFNNDL